ncbi:MAG: glyoxalase superfamily protein [Bacteroidota bacterium]|nr:glyoxalase superfamily protein [Bacteroidota bacterium]
MKLNKVIPKIFYSDIKTGLALFVECLSFVVKYSEPDGEHPFYIVDRDGVTLFLHEDDEYAKKDRPEIRIDTDDIDAFHAELMEKDIKLFHPNLPFVKLQPWGLKEFALLDKSGVCVIIQQSN